MWLMVWIFGLFIAGSLVWLFAFHIPQQNKFADIRDALAGDMETPSDVYGSAHFGTYEEARAAGVGGKAYGVPLGFFRSSLGGGDVPGDYPFPMAYDAPGHGGIFASARSGKFVTLLAPFLLSDSDCSAVVIDIKGECAGVTARRRRDLGHKVVILNPYKLHREHFDSCGFPEMSRFNPLASLDPESLMFEDECAKLAAALIVDDGASEKYFVDTARELWAALFLFVCLQSGETRTLPRCRQLLSTFTDKNKREAWRKTAKALDNDAINNKTAFLDSDNKSTYDVLSTATTQTAFLDSRPIRESLSGSDIDFRNLKREKTTVYVILPESQLKTQRKWFRLVVTASLSGVMDTPKKPDDLPVWGIWDEFAQLGYMEEVENALAMSAGLGLRMLFVLQDLPQLEDIYGKRWESFISACGFIAVFGTNENTTAKYFSDRAGTYTVKTKTYSTHQVTMKQAAEGHHGVNVTWGEAACPLIVPGHFYDMRFNADDGYGSGVVWVKGYSTPFAVGRKAYYRNPAQFKEGDFDANPCR